MFYFFKTAFWPLTYLFIACYVIMLIIFLLNFDWDLGLAPFIRDFAVPVILAMIFLLVFLVNGNFAINIVIKDFLLILVLFSLFYFLYWNNIYLKSELPILFIFRFIVFLTILISILNLINQFYPALLSVQLHDKLNISIGPTIAYDYNFFCLFLIFGLLIINNKNKNDFLYYRLTKAQIASLSLIFVLNIIISGSRRALFVLTVLMILKVIFSLLESAKSNTDVSHLKKLVRILSPSILFFVILIFALHSFPKQTLKNLAARYSSLTGKNESIFTEKILWRRESTLPLDKKYLIDKASIEGEEKFWKCISAPGTSIRYIDTKYGKSIMVTRTGGGNDGFSLQYVGPEILYYANHTYKISFKIKFIKGRF